MLVVVVRPVESVTVAVSVWVPSGTVAVFHTYEVDVPATVWVETTVGVSLATVSMKIVDPMASGAAIPTLTVWPRTAPSAGLVNDAARGGLVALATETITELDGALFPAASRATAVSVCVPSVAVAVSQETEYGGTRASAPTLIPSSLN